MAKSHASTVKLESDKESSLDQHPGVQEAFAKAHQDYVPLELEDEQERPQGRASSMIEQEASSPEFRPGHDLEGANDIEREHFDERWTAEQASAADYLKLYEDTQNEQGRDERHHERDSGDDYDNSL